MSNAQQNPILPGPNSREMIKELEHYVVATPMPFVLDLAKCHGMWLATVDGQELFDWAGYYASKLVGHNHPLLYERDYLERLSRAANNKTANPDFLTPECLQYYKLLYQLAPVCMRNPRLEVYVVNSGAEAVENMMKYFINLHLQKHQQKKRSTAMRKFIYFDQAFHGRTVFALNVTRVSHDPLITRDFQGFHHGNYRIPFPAIDTFQTDSENQARINESLDVVEDILKRDAENVVGIILEPLQGAGGHRLALPEFYRRLSRLAYDFDISLGYDEVQTAGGQTGTFFAIDQFELPHPPHAVAAAKKLGCGVVYMLHPMVDRGLLDSTWGGTLADMVRFVQEMKIVRQERLIELVPEKTERLVRHLNALAGRFPALMRNVRGLGLYQGFSLAKPELKSKLIEVSLQQEQMLLLGAATDSIRLRPSLSVTLDDIDLFAQKLERAFESI